MMHAMVTVVCPLARDRLQQAQTLIDAMGNPAEAVIAGALEPPDGESGTHFVSLHAIPSGDGRGAWIALEVSADGTEDAALDRIATAIGERLSAVFALASDWRGGQDLSGYLRHHRVTIGGGLMDNPGIAFDGTPGFSVGRIRREAALSARCAALLAAQPGAISARDRLARVRDGVKHDAALAWAFDPPEVPSPYVQQDLTSLLPGMVASFATTYLWPVGVALLAVALIAGALAHRHPVGAFVNVLLIGAVIALVAIVLAAAVLYGKLRALEDSDSLEERAIAPGVLDGILARENRYVHNHMLSITQRKPGWVRWFTHRLVFWLIGQLAAKSYRPGFLSDIGTIHFARWVTIPGSRDFLFFSNYGGSWESYLEDFITRAHAGLTAVWSNAIGFPRSTNLFQGGATDGERFKRYARHSMAPTRFWFSAYPGLTTANIRANAAIRIGFAAAMTEDDARAWLSLFGSAARPDERLVSSDIQSLVFGGLKFLPFGEVQLYALPGEVAAAKAWLAGVVPHVAFNDGRRLGEQAVVTLALSASGLARAGLPAEGLATFPAAFLDGMAASGRSTVLGDTGPQAPEHWEWGREPLDAALLLYAETEQDLADKKAVLAELASERGTTLAHTVPLQPITDDKREPFGFVDGISQPVIRGTYKGLRAPDPIHLVEPGEFILGYPDNRGNVPPGPTLPATLDPGNALPLVARSPDFSTTRVEGARDLGANGTFLVIRQLQQDVDGFARYCEAEAARLSDRLGPPYTVNAEFVAAKMVGRWKDGSSLARHSYEPASQLRHHAGAMARPKALARDATPVDPPQQTATYNDNDFLFGTEDPEALRCPFGAHIRRANPRDSLDPGSSEQIAITNRHRILRVGRPYMPEAGRDKGLMFMCLNGDLERQFEFVQQTWLMSPSFHGLSCEKDGLMGDAAPGRSGYTIPTRDGPVALSPVPRFVTVLGGGYFFMPGRRLLAFLAAPAG